MDKILIQLTILCGYRMGEVNSRRESRASERGFELPAQAQGAQPPARNGGIPGLQRADRWTESGFADVVLAERASAYSLSSRVRWR